MLSIVDRTCKPSVLTAAIISFTRRIYCSPLQSGLLSSRSTDASLSSSKSLDSSAYISKNLRIDAYAGDSDTTGEDEDTVIVDSTVGESAITIISGDDGGDDGEEHCVVDGGDDEGECCGVIGRP